MFYKLSFSLLMPLPFIPSIPALHVGYDSAVPKLKYNNHALPQIRSFLVVVAKYVLQVRRRFLGRRKSLVVDD